MKLGERDRVRRVERECEEKVKLMDREIAERL